jgi:hypothetical protein
MKTTAELQLTRHLGSIKIRPLTLGCATHRCCSYTLLLMGSTHMRHLHPLVFRVASSLPHPLCRSRFLVRAQLLTRV